MKKSRNQREGWYGGVIWNPARFSKIRKNGTVVWLKARVGHIRFVREDSLRGRAKK